MTDQILRELTKIVGEKRLLTGTTVAAHEFPWSTHAVCQARAIVYPTSTEEVAAILRVCHRLRQSVVPFGGTTNLVQGCATTPADIVLGMEKMNRIEEIDPTARTMTADAGVTLQEAQEAADRDGLFFPVDIGARGNCQLGGIVSTNAGGTKVIHYGMTRDVVLGLEAVLADGTVISSMNRYLKNNSGFDLKQLFIGSEGVLGVITRIVFRLRAKPRSHNVALLACKSFDDVMGVLHMAHEVLPNTLTAFEVMWNAFYELAVKPRGRLPAPLEPGAGFYVLLESMGADSEHDAVVFEAMLESLLDRGLLVDGIVAKSDKERARLWKIRDEVEPVIDNARNFDVSLNSRDVGEYASAVETAICARFPAANVIAFGHLGDNNLHLSVSMGDFDNDKEHVVETIIYERLAEYDGAISAEHGIGLEKRAYLPISRTAAEIELMSQLKKSLDPCNILNPGKVIDIRSP